jgi:hypothetical protein
MAHLNLSASLPDVLGQAQVLSRPQAFGLKRLQRFDRGRFHGSLREIGLLAFVQYELGM